LVLLGAATLSLGVVAPVADAAVDVRIHDIQGSMRLSPLDGQQVAGVPGVVTAVRSFGSARGFWVQDPNPDSDVVTSEGLLVFTGSVSPQVTVGDAVTLAGTVDEFYPDGSADTAVHQSTTELTKATWTIESSGNPLPAAERIAVPDRMAPDAGGGNIETLPLRPSRYAVDYYEAREGMRVRVDDARVVGPTTAYNELWLTTKPRENRSARGGTLYSSYRDDNTGRVKVESLIPFAQQPFPQANVGDALTGETSGPLDYDEFGGYMVQATALGTLTPGGLQPEATRPQRTGELAVATYNVENLSPNDAAAKFQRLAHGVVESLASPDILSLEEIQDNNGTTDDTVVAADETLRLFTDAVVAAGGPRYEWRAIDPVDDADGGAPGGNIRVAFLFNPARVSFVDRPGGDATTPVAVAGRHLSVSPGRIDPTSDAWTDSRKPLAGEFTFRGRTVFVVANHFNSKGGDQPMYGRFQPPARSSETQRLKQATEVHDFVAQLQRVDRLANIVVLGDLNDFQFAPAVRKLTERLSLVDLITVLPRDERYSYVYEGNSQTLDHVLVSGKIVGLDYDVVHVNAEFANQASDHDPQVVRLTLLG
jgi:predicted extracellular nuclease